MATFTDFASILNNSDKDLFILWRFMKFPLHMKHHISWQNVSISLCPCLSVHAIEHITQIMKHIKTIDQECQLTFKNRICGPCIPDKIGLVERAVGIATACVDSEIC